MAVLGLRGTGSFDADQRPKNYRGVLLLLNPNTEAPLTALLGQLRNEPTDDPEFKIFIKDLPDQRATVSGTVTTAATTVTLTGTNENTKFKPGHAVINELSGEVFWVTASSTADQLTVERAKGSTAVQMLTGEGLLILGSHHEEGAGVPTAVSYDPTVVLNFTQIFRTAIDLTGTAQATRLRYADRPMTEFKREALEIHAIEMEKQFLFGSGVEDTSGANAERTTKGLFFFFTSNVQDFLGSVDIDTWENFLEDIFEDGSNEKLLLCGNRQLNVINKLARNHGDIQITPVPRNEVFGMRITEYTTPYGSLMLRQHPLLSKNPTFNDWGFYIDTRKLVYRFLRGRDTRYLTERQSPGDDAAKDEYMTEAGLEVQFEQAHGLTKNMTTAVP